MKPWTCRVDSGPRVGSCKAKLLRTALGFARVSSSQLIRLRRSVHFREADSFDRWVAMLPSACARPRPTKYQAWEIEEIKQSMTLRTWRMMEYSLVLFFNWQVCRLRISMQNWWLTDSKHILTCLIWLQWCLEVFQENSKLLFCSEVFRYGG